MSDLEHSFEEHVLSPVFRRAAFESQQQTGEPRISSETSARLAHECNISLGEAVALAYLAKHQVADFMFDAEFEVELLVQGEVS